MAGSLALSAGQQWPPSHVQVTVLRARGLRAKGKQGSDAFTIIQLGRERFCTAVVEKSLEPVWREECSFELLPDWLEPAAAKELLLTVLHRSLMGLDRFLGQLSLPLAALYQDSSKKPRWYKLSSKPGQKEKERGEIQVSIQFVRNNLTASMFDLSSKEKHRSALDKLKDKVKGKKKHDSLTAESASAIVPSSVGQITSDEEFSEKGTPEKKSKKSFFSKPKLHRSSLTKSNSSLSSQQSVRSLESISNSTGVTNLPSPKATSAPGAFHPPPNEPIATNPSLVKVLTHKRALSDEVNQAFKSNMDLLAPKTSPISRSLLCINGSHIYNEEHSPKSPSGLFPKSTPLSRSFQNVASKAEEPGQRTSVEETDKQKWAAGNVEVRMVPPVITVNNEESTQVLSAEGQRKEVVGSVQGTKPVHIAAPIISTVEPTKSSVPHEAKKASIFPFGSDNKDSESRRSRTPSPVRKCSSLGERTKSSGWFLKEANHKPSLTFGSQGTPDASISSPSTAGSSGKDWFAVEKSAAEEVIPCSPPPSTQVSTVTTASVSCSHTPDPSAMSGPPVDPDITMQSANFHTPGLSAEVGGQEMPSQWVPPSTVPASDSNDQVPSAVPREMKTKCPEEDDHSSTLAQTAELNVEIDSSGPQIRARTKSSNSSINLDNGSLNLVWGSKPADRVDLKIYSALDAVSPALSLVESVEAPEVVQSGTFSDEGLEMKPSPDSLTSRREEIPGAQPGQRNVERSPALVERGRSTSSTTDEAEGELPLGPTSPVTDPSLVPIFPGKQDNAQGDACLDPPAISPELLHKVGVESCEDRPNVTLEGRRQDTAVPGVEGLPETSADEGGVTSDPLDTLDIHLQQTGPPPPKPPRLLACTYQAVGDEVGRVEDRQEIKMPFGCAATTLQLSEQQVDAGFEQKASLVVSSPAGDEVNPEQTASTSTPSATEEPVRPSNEVVTKGKASCGTFELSLNEKTVVDHYKTCLSTLSAEGINMSIGNDGNSNKLDVFQQTPSSGLIEVHQAHHFVEVQPAVLKTTVGVNSLETASLVEQHLERWDAFPEGGTSLAWPDQTDQSEQDFVSAIEGLPHKSSPLFSECERTLASGKEFSGELESQVNEDGERNGESSTLRDSKETLTRNAERESQQGETVDLTTGIGPLLCSESLTAGMKMEQRAEGGEVVLECCAGGEDSALEQWARREEPVSEHHAGGEVLVSEQRSGGEESALEQRGGEEEFVSEQRPAGEESASAEDPPPSGLCPPSTVKPSQGQVMGKVDISPHNGHLFVRNADLQALGSRKPVVGEGSSAACLGRSAADDSSFEEGLNFEDLHLHAAPPALQATNLTREQMVPPAQSNKPLAFSTPHPVAVTNSRVTDLPSPILFPSDGAPPSGATHTAVAPPTFAAIQWFESAAAYGFTSGDTAS
ncbi:uncharacterized protein LOC127582864 isoform X1 [Pristis pectinata]|uniref:uncharacterized protein LOC127582864 isoform X1 n=1 Tax=Pristis pectinata TaxID=685728 RepID=UPI00223D7BF6|nr:uncharacterized protein LOC127582864 isoform X1 [Pristis pectinata]